MTLMLVTPSLKELEAYVSALKRGFSPNNIDGERTTRAELARIAVDPVGFIESIDGSRVQRECREYIAAGAGRIPGFRRWLMKDDRFIGSYGFRWIPSTEALPPHIPGHVGYAVAEWERRKGYATKGLRLLLEEIKTYGLDYVEVSIESSNHASIGVTKACGGEFHHRLDESRFYPQGYEDVYRIALTGKNGEPSQSLGMSSGHSSANR